MASSDMPGRSRGTLTRLVAVAGLAAIAFTGAAQGVVAQSPASMGNVTFGSNESNDVPKQAVQALVDYCSAQSGTTVKVNTTQHETFQEQISNYLQATPDDIVKWFAGHRLRFFADQGLLTNIDDVWAEVGSNYSDAFKGASTGNDSHQYLVPLYNYPWVVSYRKSLFTEKGYTVPTTWDEFIALAKKMQADGIIPMAAADIQGWPAMGMFDILDMRMNGYDFHIGLLNGDQKWTDPKVKAVFEKWRELLTYSQEGAAGRKWEEAAAALNAKQVGMMLAGSSQVTQVSSAADKADLDFFPFPVMGNQYDSEMAIDAPIDGLMLSKAPKNLDGAKAFLKCAASGAAQIAYVGLEGSIAAGKDADRSGYDPLQAKAADIIAGSGKIAQFLDRDTRADFTANVITAIQDFLTTPTTDLDALLSNLQANFEALPPES